MAGNNDPNILRDYRQWSEVVERYSPVVILFPEYDPVKGEKDQPSGADYHPRDLRLVLSGASGSLWLANVDAFLLSPLSLIAKTFPGAFALLGSLVLALLVSAFYGSLDAYGASQYVEDINPGLSLDVNPFDLLHASPSSVLDACKEYWDEIHPEAMVQTALVAVSITLSWGLIFSLRDALLRLAFGWFVKAIAVFALTTLFLFADEPIRWLLAPAGALVGVPVLVAGLSLLQTDSQGGRQLLESLTVRPEDNAWGRRNDSVSAPRFLVFTCRIAFLFFVLPLLGVPLAQSLRESSLTLAIVVFLGWVVFLIASFFVASNWLKKRNADEDGKLIGLLAGLLFMQRVGRTSLPPGDVQYEAAGAPSDRDHHAKRYQELLKAKDRSATHHVTAYAKVTAGMQTSDPRFKDVVAIQYWLAYYYNNWENTHEMDWEQITVYLKVKPGQTNLLVAMNEARPFCCGFSAHDGGYIADWNSDEMHHWPDDVNAEGATAKFVLPPEGLHPHLYVGWGSHANYPLPGHHRPTTTFAGLRFGGREASVLRKTLYSYIDVTQPRPAEPAIRKAYDARPLEPGKANKSATRVDEESGDGPAVEKLTDPARAGPYFPAVVLLTDGQDLSGGKDQYWQHYCTEVKEASLGETQLSPAFECLDNQKDQACVRDFRWLNVSGVWGDAGGLLRDTAPKSLQHQSSWDPFRWLNDCDRLKTGDGVTAFVDALEKAP